MESYTSLTSSIYCFGDYSQYNFIDAVNDDIICVICKEVLREPQQTKCGHRMCLLCIQSRLSTDREFKCPANEEDCETIRTNSDYHPDRPILRQINLRDVRCNHYESGCQETMQLRTLKFHLEKCEYTPVKCVHDGCTVSPQRKLLNEHIENECDFTEIECEYCKVSFIRKDMSYHIGVDCDLAPITCPHCRQGGILRKDMVECHLLNCPKLCPFSMIGCDQVESHINTHMDLLLRKVIALTGLVENARKDIITEQAKISERLVKLEEQITAIASAESDVKNLKEDFRRTDVAIQQTSRVAIVSPNMQQVNLTEREDEIKEHAVKIERITNTLEMIANANHDGLLIWKLNNYTRRVEEARSGGITRLYSQPFYTSKFGYKLQAIVYPNGNGEGVNTHISLFIVIAKTDYDDIHMWPFKHVVTFTLLNLTSSDHISHSIQPDGSNSFTKPIGEYNTPSGLPKFIEHKMIADNKSKYCVDDTLFFRIVVDMSNR